jgi:hypothetical protein
VKTRDEYIYIYVLHLNFFFKYCVIESMTVVKDRKVAAPK